MLEPSKTEYIEREATIAMIYGQHVGGKEACENARPNTYGADLREIVADIEDIPAADVRPVVLCPECKYSYVCCGRLCCSHGVCVDSIVREDFFCADGEKRKEETKC